MNYVEPVLARPSHDEDDHRQLRESGAVACERSLQATDENIIHTCVPLALAIPGRDEAKGCVPIYDIGA